ncbi:MAG TPA: dolichyl-phosphate beta-glucosyltransferase [Bryobacteraceae bacterium]|nr:dolichyl-phosphate beta-glucosyltransferase [Bryobacteraceae bacterium]
MTPDLTLILPAYNEAKRIRNTIEEAIAFLKSQQYSYQIIVAADGNDGTREIVREMSKSDPNIEVCGHEERLGKGRGVREAVEKARGAYIGYADADNKVPIDELKKVMAALIEGFPVVIGSRAMNQSQIEKRQPLYRQIGSMGFHVFMQTVVGLPGITDSQCGFKFFRQDVAKRIFRTQKIDGYMFDVEILALAARFGYSIAQIPIRWRDDGDSRLDLVAGNIRNVKDILRIRLSLMREPRVSPALKSRVVTKSS